MPPFIYRGYIYAVLPECVFISRGEDSDSEESPSTALLLYQHCLLFDSCIRRGQVDTFGEVSGLPPKNKKQNKIKKSSSNVFGEIQQISLQFASTGPAASGVDSAVRNMEFLPLCLAACAISPVGMPSNKKCLIRNNLPPT